MVVSAWHIKLETHMLWAAMPAYNFGVFKYNKDSYTHPGLSLDDDNFHRHTSMHRNTHKASPYT